jgi:methylthioribose-1-phosphate isomerase
MAHYLPGCTKVFVGADALYTDGTVVNKMGTLAIAMLAKAFQKPVYVLTITSKLYLPSLKGFKLQLERRPATEIQNPIADETISRNLTIENTFFEEVSGEHTTFLVTEKGVIKPCQLLEAAKS